MSNAIRKPIAERVPSADDVRDQLDRVLANPSFQASDRRRAFLRFIVEEALAGRAERLKGYTVALAVFGRDETFDAQSDPVVRLEARRLRRDLDSYYVDAGSRDAVRILIPKGSYVPRFEWLVAPTPVLSPAPDISVAMPASAAEPVLPLPVLPPPPEAAATPDRERRSETEFPPVPLRPPPSPERTGTKGAYAKLGHPLTRKIAVAVLAATLAVVIAIAVVFATRKQTGVLTAGAREPAVVVVPFEVLSATDDTRYFASGMSQELISNLFRFPGLRLYTLPAGFHSAETAPAELGRNLGVAYVVTGSVRANTDEVRVATQVINAGTGQVLWTRTYARPWRPEALIEVQGELAGEIAAVVGQPYGVVRADMNTRQATPAVSNMQSYVCVLRAYGYRRTFALPELAPVLQCLEEAVRRDPDYSDAWAMLGWLHLDVGRIGYTGDANRQHEYAKALDAASRAAKLAPDNTLALKALAAVNHYLERYDESERLTRQALALNPHDPEAMAQLGWRLAVRGRFEEGIPILKRAIERTVNPPGWYYHLVAIDLYLKGEYVQMRDVAERSATDASGFGHALVAIAAGELGDQEAARQALARLAKFDLLARDPAAYMRRHGATDQLVDRLMAGLQNAQRVAAQ